jgi:hypothetical protein
MRKRVGLCALLVSFAAPARADVTVTIDPGQGARFAEQAKIPLQQIEQQLQSELQTLFQTYRLPEYLRAFSDAQSCTARGLGVDYGSTIGLFEVGIAGNVALNGKKSIAEGEGHTPPMAGVATNLTAMAGLNLGFLGLRPVTLFGNFFTRKFGYREFGAEVFNYGAHLQIKLFQPRKETLWNAFLQWGGIALTSGFDHARLRFTLANAKPFTRVIPVQAEGQTARIGVVATGDLALESRTFSVPIELTTNFRFLYVLSAYGGLGFDFQFGGGSDLDINLDGKLTGTVASQPPIDLGGVRVVASEEAKPSPSKLRGMVGLQANLWFFRVFTQLNVMPEPFVASVAIGARLVF